MSRDEAFRLIELFRDWNHSQTSIRRAMGRFPSAESTAEDAIYDERRETLAEAWRALRAADEEAK